MSVSVRVPASSANLGPGFDALGLALALHDEVTAEVVGTGPAATAGAGGTAEPGEAARTGVAGDDRHRGDGAGGPGRAVVTVHGEGAGDLPTDERHLVVRAMHAAFAELGTDPPPVALTCRNRIPQARGLGSSSAAIVAGVLLARGLLADGRLPGHDPALADRLDDRAALRLAARLEGHPDNVAACLLGGFTIAWTGSDGAHAARLTPAEGVRPTVFVPAGQGLTEVARAALPERVPHADAAHAAGRSALLVAALTGAPELLFTATEDRLHQPYRAEAAPATTALVERLRAAGVAAVVSGAGPSVLALTPVPSEVEPAPGWVPHVLDVDSYGAVVGAGTIFAYTGEDRVTRRHGPVLPQVGQVV